MRLIAVLLATFLIASAHAQTAVKFALDWRFEGPAAPYFVAIDKGYYKAEGLDVSIDPGSGSVEGINRVASGNYAFGFADINSLIKYRDNPKNAAIQAVMMVYDTPAFSIVALKKSGIAKPRDLEGKTIGTGAIGALLHQLCVALLVKNKVDVKKINFVNIGASGDVFRAAIMGTIDAGTGETAVLEDMI